MNSIRENKSFIAFVTWMQAIGCTLVILGHSYPFIVDIPLWAKNLQLFIYDFHMALFVWCSGYLLTATKQNQKYGFVEYFKRRFMRLLLPYLALSLVGIFPKVILQKYLNDNLSLNLIEIVRAFFIPRESIWGHFWFLPMIFTLGICGYELLTLSNRFPESRGGLYLWYILLFATVLHFLPQVTNWFSANDILHYFVYLILRMICGQQ